MTRIYKKTIKNYSVMSETTQIQHHDQKKKVDIAMRNAKLMSAYLSLGFRTLFALKEIFKAHYPEIPDKEIKRVWDIRSRDASVLDKFETLIEKLKFDV